MSFDFSGKVALVTGGGQGIGFAYVKALAKHGVKGIVIADTNIYEAQKSVGDAEIDNVEFVKVDVTNETQLENAFQKAIEVFGTLDIVINNAGVVNDKDWKKLISINCEAVVSGTLLGFKYMGKDKSGHGGIIINTSSFFGIHYLTASPIYTASKHFVVALTRSMGTQYYYDLTGVKVLAICPGATKTNIATGETLPFDGILKMLYKQAKEILPSQSPENLGNALITVLNGANNGSTWISWQDKEAFEEVATGTLYV